MILAPGFRYLVRGAASLIAAGFMFTTLSTAQTAKSPVDIFLENPALVLSQYPNGGSELMSPIRDTSTQHPEALQTIIGLLASGNADQQSAVVSGLGRAYKIVLNADQNYATQIAAAIGNSSSSAAKTAYATGDRGGGGSAGSADTGGSQSGGPNSGAGQATGASNLQISSQTFTGGGASVSSTTSSGSSGSVSAH